MDSREDKKEATMAWWIFGGKSKQSDETIVLSEVTSCHMCMQVTEPASFFGRLLQKQQTELCIVCMKHVCMRHSLPCSCGVRICGGYCWQLHGCNR
jgi:hypothetical protein